MLCDELIQKECQYLFQHRQDIFLFVYHLLQMLQPVLMRLIKMFQWIIIMKEQQQTNRLNPVGQR